VDKGAVTFGSSVNSRIFLVGSKRRQMMAAEGYVGRVAGCGADSTEKSVVFQLRQLLVEVCLNKGSTRNACCDEGRRRLAELV